MSDLKITTSQALSSLLPTIQTLLSSPSHPKPLILGLTGLQGSGKSTWASHLIRHLTSPPHNLKALAVSLDDFYKTHDGLVKRREKDPGNKLFRTRGQPGTHDEVLARRFFEGLRKGDAEIRVPGFDKSRFGGEGDRASESEWVRMQGPVDVVVFEGWCLGFQPLVEEGEIVGRREEAMRRVEMGEEDEEEPICTLGRHEVEHLVEVNECLRRYCEVFMGARHFDLFVQLDTERLRNVYAWRREQEHKMIEKKGEGMSDEEVKQFIVGYMPAYELYLDGLRNGLFSEEQKRQGKRHLRVTLGKNREVLGMEDV